MFSSEGRLGLIEHLVTGYVVLRGRADQVVLLTTLAAIREHATRLCENGTWCTLRTTREEGPGGAATIPAGGIEGWEGLVRLASPARIGAGVEDATGW